MVSIIFDKYIIVITYLSIIVRKQYTIITYIMVLQYFMCEKIKIMNTNKQKEWIMLIFRMETINIMQIITFSKCIKQFKNSLYNEIILFSVYLSFLFSLFYIFSIKMLLFFLNSIFSFFSSFSSSSSSSSSSGISLSSYLVYCKSFSIIKGIVYSLC